MMVNGGLSLLVHLIIIGLHRLKGRLVRHFIFLQRQKKQGKNIKRIRFGFLTSLLIIFCVSVGTILIGISIIRGALNNDRANYSLISKYINNQNKNKLLTENINAPENVLLVNPEVPIFVYHEDCLEFFSARAKKYNNSVVEYLQLHGQKNNFIARREMALKYGISNYQGTVNQNRDLLWQLFIDYKEFSDLPCNFE